MLRRVIVNDPSLVALDHQLEYLEEDDIVALCRALKTNNKIKILKLTNNEFSLNSCRAIADMLEGNTTLQSLYLGRNHFCAEGFKTIVTALKENKTLQYMDLNGIYPCIEDVRALIETLKKNTTLRVLDVSHNHLGIEAGEAFAELLLVNSSLESLNLGFNHIDVLGGNAIAWALRCNITVRHLNLESNPLGAEVGKAMASALSLNSTLQFLNLEDTKLGDVGGVAIASVLHANTSLRSLNIKNNRLGPSVKKAVGEALKVNSGIVDMHFFGGEDIGEALEVNTTLLFLPPNSISNYLYPLKRNEALAPCINHLNLLGNNLSLELDKAKIKQSLRLLKELMLELWITPLQKEELAYIHLLLTNMLIAPSSIDQSKLDCLKAPFPIVQNLAKLTLARSLNQLTLRLNLKKMATNLEVLRTTIGDLTGKPISRGIVEFLSDCNRLLLGFIYMEQLEEKTKSLRCLLPAFAEPLQKIADVGLCQLLSTRLDEHFQTASTTQKIARAQLVLHCIKYTQRNPLLTPLLFSTILQLQNPDKKQKLAEIRKLRGDAVFLNYQQICLVAYRALAICKRDKRNPHEDQLLTILLNETSYHPILLNYFCKSPTFRGALKKDKKTTLICLEQCLFLTAEDTESNLFNDLAGETPAITAQFVEECRKDIATLKPPTDSLERRIAFIREKITLTFEKPPNMNQFFKPESALSKSTSISWPHGPMF